MKKGIFKEDYVRGGARTLFMTREDVVETLAMIRHKYPGNLKGLLFESKELVRYWKECES